jgi:hypothetical protein
MFLMISITQRIGYVPDKDFAAQAVWNSLPNYKLWSIPLVRDQQSSALFAV